MKNKLQIAMSLAVVMAMLVTSLALADVITPDADIVTAGDQASQNFGIVAPGAILTPKVSFKLVCSGKQHVDNGQTVNLNFNLGGSTVPAGSLTATNASIGAVPAIWPDDSTGGGPTNCATSPEVLGDNGDSTVTITAPMVGGTYTYVVRYDFGFTPSEGSGDANDIVGSNTTVSFTLTVPNDTTPPIITKTITGTLGSNGWYTSDVFVDWTVTDPESSFTTVGCVDTTINSDTAGTPLSCSATSTGGTSSDSVTIKRDATAPSIAASLSPASPAPSGWYNGSTGAPTVSFTCSDAMSGLAGACPSAYTFGEGGSQNYSQSVSDMAGNSASAGVSNISVDLSAPVINCSVPANNWYGDDVTVNCTADGSVSGLAIPADASFALSTSVAAGTETASASTGSKTVADVAGNSASAGPYTFKVDKNAPEVSCGSADSAWHADNQSVGCTATDGGSGLATPASFSLSTSVVDDTETDSAYTDHQNVCDLAGNCVTAGPIGPFKIDRKAPSVSATPDRPADFNSWYNQALTITFSGTDGGSGGVTCDPAVDYSGPDDDTALVSGSCADAVGNSASASFGFKYDGTAPTAALSVTAGTPGTNGWYTSDVTVHTSGTGSVSGVTCSDDQYQTVETTGAVFNGSCTSGAGLTTDAAPLTIKLDKTGPTAVLSASGTPGLNGWYISDVTISTSGTDTISAPVTCTADQSQTSDTTGAAFNGSCTNDAGLTTDASPLTVKRDTVAPTISASLSPALPASGWWNNFSGAPTVSFTCDDATSGVVVCPASHTFGEGENQAYNDTVYDNAGHSASAGVTDIDVDLTAPTLSWVGGPTDGGNYDFGFVPSAPTCTASDALAGPNGCSVADYGTSVGPHTMTATAYDAAGNSHSDNRSYNVEGWVLKGFYQPVDMNNVYNTVKNGSTVPLKFEVFTKLSGVEITDTSFVKLLTYAQVSCNLTSAEDLIETVATGGTVLRYDTTGGQFIFNWKTPSGTAGKCFRVTMKTDDGSLLVAYFKMK